MEQTRSKRRPREDPCSICNHYHDYEAGEPCGVCGHVMAPHEKKQGDTVIPANIIPGFLYLGSYDTASRSGLLKTMGITHILNTVPSCQALFKNTFTYHTVTRSPPSYEECFKFIEDTSKLPDSKLLVYCMSGASKSPAVVIAYLMKARKWRLAESYKWVKDKRPTIHINEEESGRLIEFEQALYGSCSAPEGLAALDAACGGFSLCTTFVPGPGPAAQLPQPTTPPTFGGMDASAQWSMSAQPAAPVVFGSNGSVAATEGQGQQNVLQPLANPVFCFGSAAPLTSSKVSGGNEMEM